MCVSKRLYLLLLFCVQAVAYGSTVIGIFGGENCPWSEKLKKEIWENRLFQDRLKEAGFKKEEKVPASTEVETPALFLQNSRGEEIGRIGYLFISPEKYVDLFQEMASIYEMKIENLSTAELLSLFRKSEVLGMTSLQEKILAIGLKKESGTDFLFEYYAQICGSHPKRARKVKKQIRGRISNSADIEWRLAFLSFQARKEFSKDIKTTVKPMEKFLSRYKTSENVWRGHYLIAEFYKEKNQIDPYKFHAKQAQNLAPEELKTLLEDL